MIQRPPTDDSTCQPFSTMMPSSTIWQRKHEMSFRRPQLAQSSLSLPKLTPFTMLKTTIKNTCCDRKVDCCQHSNIRMQSLSSQLLRLNSMATYEASALLKTLKLTRRLLACLQRCWISSRERSGAEFRNIPASGIYSL